MKLRSLARLAFVLTACRAEPQAAPSQRVGAPPSASRLSPGDTLDRMDARTPVPLLPMMAHHQKQNMRDHLAAVEDIITASTRREFVAVDAAARRLGYSEAMGKMCTHMGKGAPGFAQAALTFHHAADQIGVAARKRDDDAVFLALGQTLAHCTSCHSSYKQQVVDEATWSLLAAAEAPHGHQPIE